MAKGEGDPTADVHPDRFFNLMLDAEPFRDLEASNHRRMAASGDLSDIGHMIEVAM
uniref:Uncharacterized protein n=1 Tax=uncultured bacterium A1Q1_fos_962 TaxID=1256592 RepID=L7VYM4_9BACT|nr:hypothetical protein [uncultured bacterium A1Q1_fos_962]